MPVSSLRNTILMKNDYKDVLETIENHDNKDYPQAAEGISALLNVLSVADDLDAFGFTGIYRYSEIYLARGINPLKLGNLIRENAAGRFENLNASWELRVNILRDTGRDMRSSIISLCTTTDRLIRIISKQMTLQAIAGLFSYLCQ